MILSNVVNGRSVAAADTMEFVDPSTGRPIGEAPRSSAADVDRAIAAADDAFHAWRRSTPSQRQKALLDLADLLDRTARSCSSARCETPKNRTR